MSRSLPEFPMGRSPHELGSLAVWVAEPLKMKQTEPDPLQALIAEANEIASELALLEADAGLLRERANQLAMQLALLPERK
jgi:hypothetical protein